MATEAEIQRLNMIRHNTADERDRLYRIARDAGAIYQRAIEVALAAQAAYFKAIGQ